MAPLLARVSQGGGAECLLELSTEEHERHSSNRDVQGTLETVMESGVSA